MSKDQNSMNTNRRFNSKIGFILACVGSAVGMANIWMFPYRVGQYGGAAFLLIYLFFIALFSYVGLSAEFAIGRRANTGTLGAYEYAWDKKGKGKLGLALGYIPLFGSMGIAIGYAIIVSWVLRTLGGAVTGTLFQIDSAEFFSQATGAFGSLPWHSIVVIGTLLTLVVGAKSIEKTNKVMMPAFFILFLILAIRVGFLPGAQAGYKYLLIPDWSYVFKPITWIMAMGQAFFSLSITGSGMIVYGAYLSPDEDIVSGALSTGIFDVVAALVSAFVVIPACFAFNIPPNAGPPLMFITIPKILAQIPFGRLFAIIFFLSVIFAGISSLQNMFEVVGESIQNRFKLNRKTVIILLAVICLGIGIFIEAEPLVGMWMDVISIYVIPFGAVLGAFSWYYILGNEDMLDELNKGSQKVHGSTLISIAKYLYVPISIAIFVLGIIFGGIG
ncbi:sodium-dependent transporter [Anaerophilus nitritogenes]|uniref:sodium-dependent transporter n=1 Tax=Anaerophilus nitritogenes TaxID=2498136 RepID=UPI00101CD9B9|nr:sodium-dependent transporter [Anaerophilus nitritogenes]